MYPSTNWTATNKTVSGQILNAIQKVIRACPRHLGSVRASTKIFKTTALRGHLSHSLDCSHPHIWSIRVRPFMMPWNNYISQLKRMERVGAFGANFSERHDKIGLTDRSTATLASSQSWEKFEIWSSDWPNCPRELNIGSLRESWGSDLWIFSASMC